MKLFRTLKQIPFQVAVFCGVHWGLRENHNLNRRKLNENTQYRRGDFLRAYILYGGNMGDLLKQSAEAYKQLSLYRYRFLLGRKSQLYRFEISFPDECYWHLAGLHKMHVEAFKNRKKALYTILTGSFRSPASANPVLTGRWRGICSLQALIETNKIVFHYSGHEFSGSRICADYVLSNDEFMFFIADAAPVNIFEPNLNQLEQLKRCPRLTTLKIERVHIISGEIVEVFCSPSYHSEASQ